MGLGSKCAAYRQSSHIHRLGAHKHRKARRNCAVGLSFATKSTRKMRWVNGAAGR